MRKKCQCEMSILPKTLYFRVLGEHSNILKLATTKDKDKSSRLIYLCANCKKNFIITN